MIDSAFDRPVRVSTESTSGPYILIPPDQLPDLELLLEINGVEFQPAADSAGSKVVDIPLADAAAVQRLLDEIDEDKQGKLSVAVRLNELLREVQLLMDLIEPNRYSMRDKEAAQQSMKALKERFREDISELERSNMTAAEQAFLLPAIQSAKCQIGVKSNSNPDGTWRSELYSCRIDLDHPLFDLRRILKVTNP